jgi:hypothetical protein
MAQTIKIFYHLDVDGIFSAILYTKLLTDNGQENARFVYQPVNYDWKTWQDDTIRKKDEIIVVVDFPYHPDCNVWYDHHESGLGKFATISRPGKFQPGAQSCAKVIYEMQDRDRFLDEDLIGKIVKEVSMIDFALYPTIDTVYNPTTFGPKLRLALLEEGDENFANELIRMFSKDRTLLYNLIEGQIPWSVNWRYQKVKIKLEESYKEFVKVAKIDKGIVYFEVPHFFKSDRYFPFRKFPQSFYTIYLRDMTWINQGCFISVSKNPWNPFTRTFSIRELCERYGGGGHFDVGGIATKGTLEEGRDIFQKVLADLYALHTHYIQE